MTHGSLFSGMGGFDLAAEWMAWENIFHCEWNPFCQRILKYYWPRAQSYDDIKKTDFTIFRGAINVLSGGFPCQPYSNAGKRKGKADSRHLWPEMLRAVMEIQPDWVVGENVRGLVNWNKGLVFHEVQADLEAEGYEVFPFLLPACGKNAPHRRERIWFVAHRNVRGQLGDKKRTQSIESGQRRPTWSDANGNGSEKHAANAHNGGREGSENEQEKYRKGNRSVISSGNGWKNFPTQHPICNGNDGLSSKLDGITIRKWREETIIAGGNAIVPQVALEIFKAIEQYEKL